MYKLGYIFVEAQFQFYIVFLFPAQGHISVL